MKSILLTTTALVAFAGAAAADGHTSVSWGGEAVAEFNDLTGFTTSVDLTASASADLGNGVTATTSMSFEIDDEDDTVEISHGSIALTTANAGLTFGTGLNGAVFDAVGDDYDLGADGDEGVDGVTAYVEMGETTVYVSAPLGFGETELSTDDVEVGVSTTVGAATVGVGFNGAGDYNAVASAAVAGLDLNGGISSDDEWDLGAAFTAGAVTLSASTDEAEAWTVGADYDGGDLTAGIEYNADETYEITVGYAANGVAVAAAFNDESEIQVGATYAVDALTVGAGMEYDESVYAFADYDLGGGASAYVSYTDAAAELEEVGPAERDVPAGTTVGVSFSF